MRLMLACAVALLGLSGPANQVEHIYSEARAAKDRVELTRARGAERDLDGVPLTALRKRFEAARASLARALAASAPGSGEEDRRAHAVMKAALERELSLDAPGESAGATPECDYDPVALSRGEDGWSALSGRMYACFGQAAQALTFDGRALDRLTIFSLLPVTDEPERRRGLFLALAPVWRAVDGDGGAASPYRRLLGLRRPARVSATGAADLGIDARAAEAWVVSVLEAWRAGTPEAEIEPWDFAYQSGRASRSLAAAVPLAALRSVNDRFYKDLGADPVALGVHYDLAPRAGKDPVAFTTFGDRPQRRGLEWSHGEPWVFASYQVGSLDNLGELLHETGHAVHIAAIRTRPAFADWPDSDLFTEAIADLAALELHEPRWQARYLGTSVPLADAIRARYAGIVMDAAWALFELRMAQDPAARPSDVWTEITRRYLRIRPHPELSWWAVRGQLVNLPGYMLNYAAGAVLVADLRQRLRELHGPWTEGDPTWYPFVSERVYRFGLERTSRRVVLDLLGRDVSPQAILDDMRRMVSPAAPSSSAP